MHVIALAGALQDVRRLGDEASGLHAQLHRTVPSFLMVMAVPVGMRAEISLFPSPAVGTAELAIN